MALGTLERHRTTTDTKPRGQATSRSNWFEGVIPRKSLGLQPPLNYVLSTGSQWRKCVEAAMNFLSVRCAQSMVTTSIMTFWTYALWLWTLCSGSKITSKFFSNNSLMSRKVRSIITKLRSTKSLTIFSQSFTNQLNWFIEERQRRSKKSFTSWRLMIWLTSENMGNSVVTWSELCKICSHITENLHSLKYTWIESPSRR